MFFFIIYSVHSAFKYVFLNYVIAQLVQFWVGMCFVIHIRLYIASIFCVCFITIILVD